jgi:hypothetical protein
MRAEYGAGKLENWNSENLRIGEGASMALKKCYECGESVSSRARKCLKCGAPQTPAIVWFVFFIVVLPLLVWVLAGVIL